MATRPSKRPKKQQRKVPDPLLPLVDAVVDMVFARLTQAAIAAGKPSRTKPIKPKKRVIKLPAAKAKGKGKPGLAGALADLLLSDLTSQPPGPIEITKAASKRSPKRRSIKPQ